MKKSTTAMYKTGFTIVELLIVIVVIAILATISIVAYNGIQDRANDTAIQTNLRSLMNKMQLIHAENGEYPGGPTGISDFSVSEGAYAVAPTTNHNLVACRNVSDRQVFGFVARSESGKIFYVSHASGVSEYSSAWAAGSTLCGNVSSSFTSNVNGYSASNNGWQAWTGGN